MSKRHERWLNAIADDADNHLSQSWFERLRRSLRYFRTGRSKVSQKVLRDLIALEEREAGKTAIADAIDSDTEQKAETSPKLEASEALAGIRLIVVDLRGGKALQRTLDSLPLADFHSSAVVSPFDDQFSGRYFDLFEAADQAVRVKTDAEAVLLVESGTALAAIPAALSDDVDAAFLRWKDSSNGALSLALDAQALLREPLAPMIFPAVLLRPKLAAGALNFSTCLHYANWDLLLSLITEDPQRVTFTETVSASFANHSYALSQIDRQHMAEHNPKRLAHLPDAKDEWMVMRHDLIGCVVQRHQDYFKDNAAYLAAIAAATRGC